MENTIQYNATIKGKSRVVTAKLKNKRLSISVNGQLRAGFIGNIADRIFNKLVNHQYNIHLNLI